MTRLLTSPVAIYRWLGAPALRRSDNLKLVAPIKARLVRIYLRAAQKKAGAGGG